MQNVVLQCEICDRRYFGEGKYPDYCIECRQKPPLTRDDVLNAYELLKDIDTL